MVLQEYNGQILPSYHPASQYVQKVAHNLLKANHLMDETDWKIFVVNNDSIVNAFVTPDGVIVVFTGIIKVAQNEDGLATVLGHEIAHKFARHHAERLSQQNLTGFLRFLLSAFFDIPAVPSAIWIDLLLHKPNSRKHESEADRIGLEFMVNACYNPEEAVPLWRRMSKLGGTGAIPEILSTHPSSGNTFFLT
jgi:predicted Zn-dependent protease